MLKITLSIILLMTPLMMGDVYAKDVPKQNNHNYLNYNKIISTWTKALHPDWIVYFKIMSVDDAGLFVKKPMNGERIMWVSIFHNLDVEDYLIIIDNQGKIIKHKKIDVIYPDDGPDSDCDIEDFNSAHCGEA